MFTLMGAGLLSVSVLLLSWMVGATRRPDAAPWVRADIVAVTMSLIVSGLMAFGLGFLFKGLINPVALFAEVGMAGLGGLVLIGVATVWAARRLWWRGRSAGAGAEIVPMPKRPQPSAPVPTRRAA